MELCEKVKGKQRDEKGDCQRPNIGKSCGKRLIRIAVPQEPTAPVLTFSLLTTLGYASKSDSLAANTARAYHSALRRFLEEVAEEDLTCFCLILPRLSGMIRAV